MRNSRPKLGAHLVQQPGLSDPHDTTQQRGAAAIEVGLVMAFVLIPVMMLLLVVPTWIERQTAGRDAASEAARAIVLSGGDVGAAQSVVATVERGYELPPGTISLSSVSTLAAGEQFTVIVTVSQPAIALPGLGQLAGWSYEAQHVEFFGTYAELEP